MLNKRGRTREGQTDGQISVGYALQPCVKRVTFVRWNPKPLPIADFAAEFLSAENPPKIRIFE